MGILRAVVFCTFFDILNKTNQTAEIATKNLYYNGHLILCQNWFRNAESSFLALNSSPGVHTLTNTTLLNIY